MQPHPRNNNKQQKGRRIVVHIPAAGTPTQRQRLQRGVHLLFCWSSSSVRKKHAPALVLSNCWTCYEPSSAVATGAYAPRHAAAYAAFFAISVVKIVVGRAIRRCHRPPRA